MSEKKNTYALNSEADLHVVFVNEGRRVIREVYTKCTLNRAKGIPMITILDKMILNLFDEESSLLSLPFYDIEHDKFNFYTSELSQLMKDPEREGPKEILMEILEIQDIDQSSIRRIHLEPGLWKEDAAGRYRMCDNSILHILMDTKVKPMVDNGDVCFEDGAAMTIFFYCNDNLSFHYFDNRNVDDDEEECDGKCDECENPCYPEDLDDKYNCDYFDDDSIDCDNCPKCNKENCHNWETCESIKAFIDRGISNIDCDGNCKKCCNERCDVWDTCECGKAHEEYLKHMEDTKPINPNKELPKVVIRRSHRKHRR